MKRNRWIVLLVVISLFFSGLAIAKAENCLSITNEEVVKILTATVETTLTNIPKNELYEVQTNILAEKGITLFIGSNSNSIITTEDIRKLLLTLKEVRRRITKQSAIGGKWADPFTYPMKEYTKIPITKINNYLEKLNDVETPICRAEVFKILRDIKFTIPLIVIPSQYPIPEKDFGALLRETPASRI